MSKNHTYRELLEALKELSEDQLDMTVSIYNRDFDEVFPIGEFFLVSEFDIDLSDILQEDQPIMVSI